MFATAARWAAKNGKPKMAPIELTTPPEQTQSITRAIFDVVSEHGPLTISDVWEQVKDEQADHLRWMRKQQKLRLICDHEGPHKQFLYTTWFTDPKGVQSKQPKPYL
ncbi:hypothetical protein ACQ4PT_021582 [Festuca glaucescens]